MADVLDYATRLAQTIGPRPAGTEEEQQASFVIENVLQKEATLKVQSEEFNCNPNYELPRIICCIISLVLVILSMFLPILVLPSLIVCVLTAILYILEAIGVSPLTRTAKRGVSQNVIGKYIPSQSNEQNSVARRRKVVLVARYDSGKVNRELSGPLFGALNIIHWVELVAMVIIPVALLLRFLTDAEGGLLVFMNILAGIGAVGAALPVISFILHQTAPYNDGANCNAAGVAVMLEVARRVGLGLYDQEPIEEVQIHGEVAAREADLLPEEAEVEYTVAVVEPSNTTAMAPMDLSAEIATAQAARAASAQASDDAAAAPVAVQPEAPVVAEVVQPAAQAVPVAVPAPAAPAAPADNLPDWYKRAREKANKSATDSVPVQRSRFAEAMDAAQAAREAEAARIAEEQKGQVSEVEKRLAAMRASIMGEAAPATAAPAASSSTAQGETHAPSGIGGFLASTTDAPDYETASASLDDLDGDAKSETKQAGAVADRIMSHVPAAEQAAQAQPQPKASVPAASAQAQPAATTPKKEEAKSEHRPRRSISLPSLTGAIQAVNLKQASEAATKDQAQSEPVLSADEKRHDRQAALSASIPSLDAKPTTSKTKAKPASAKATVEEESVSISQAGSFSVGGGTGAFDPVGDELLANVDPDDIYIDDVADSDYEDGFTESGAMVGGAAYVDMPSSRKSRVFSKLRRNKKKKKEEETSFAEAFGLDEDFDARKVGKQRGGWESFQNESADYDAWTEDDDWNGGAFSKERLGAAISRIKPGRGADDGDHESRRSRNLDADGAPRTRFAGTEMDDDYSESRVLNPFADIPLKGLGEEREAIQEFHGGPINMEIWFVALGAELADNAGMKALIADHNAELKGAMVIDLDGLGAGDLSLIEREGVFRPAKMSSRMKRYVRKASQALGLNVGKGEMLWRNSAAYLAARNGYQTLHLVGLQGGKPAYLGQPDDVVDNLSEDIMQDNADFIMELIRAI